MSSHRRSARAAAALALVGLLAPAASAQALIEGKVVRVAEDNRTVIVDVGSRQGLKADDTLNIFAGDAILTRFIAEKVEEIWTSGRLDDPSKILVVRAGQVVSSADRPQGGVAVALPPTPPTPADAPADDRLRQLNDLKFRYEELIDKYRKLTGERDTLSRQVEFSRLQEESDKVRLLQQERDKLASSLKDLQEHFNLIRKQNQDLRTEKNRAVEELEKTKKAPPAAPADPAAPPADVAALQAKVAALEGELERARAAAAPAPPAAAGADEPAAARERISALEKELADARASAAPADETGLKQECDTLRKNADELQRQLIGMARELRSLKEQPRSGAGASGPPAPRHAIRGKVVAVSLARNLVIFNAGVRGGVEPGFVFTVVRGDKFISRARIENVDREWSSAVILTDYAKEPIQVGDSAVCGPGAEAPPAAARESVGASEGGSVPAEGRPSVGASERPSVPPAEAPKAAGNVTPPAPEASKENPPPAVSAPSAPPSGGSASSAGTVVGTTGNQGQIVLSAGSLQGGQKGQRWQVFRAGKYIAHLTVETADLDYAIARVNRLANGESVRVGDELRREPETELTGKIVDTEKGIVLSLGTRQGAAEGQLYSVLHGDQTVAKLEITRASEQWSEARILGKPLEPPKTGDKIVLDRMAPPEK